MRGMLNVSAVLDILLLLLATRQGTCVFGADARMMKMIKIELQCPNKNVVTAVRVPTAWQLVHIRLGSCKALWNEGECVAFSRLLSVHLSAVNDAAAMMQSCEVALASKDDMSGAVVQDLSSTNRRLFSDAVYGHAMCQLLLELHVLPALTAIVKQRNSVDLYVQAARFCTNVLHNDPEGELAAVHLDLLQDLSHHISTTAPRPDGSHEQLRRSCKLHHPTLRFWLHIGEEELGRKHQDHLARHRRPIGGHSARESVRMSKSFQSIQARAHFLIAMLEADPGDLKRTRFALKRQLASTLPAVVTASATLPLLDSDRAYAAIAGTTSAAADTLRAMLDLLWTVDILEYAAGERQWAQVQQGLVGSLLTLRSQTSLWAQGKLLVDKTVNKLADASSLYHLQRLHAATARTLYLLQLPLK